MWLNNTARFIEKYSYLANLIANRVGSIVLAAMMLVVVADVFLRYFFNSPIEGSVELVEVLQVAVVFLAIGYVGSKNGHIAIDFLTSRFSRRGRAINRLIVLLLSLGMVIILSWWTIVTAQGMRLRGGGAVMLPIPYFPFLYIVALGYILLGIVIVINILDSIAQVVKK